ncbi:MAG: Flp pilus assembly complex ATPase component TadA [Myxococcales bacterium]|nr:Flp pilus assembly complex ATPase component TadA [Myxococcales bacterium]
MFLITLAEKGGGSQQLTFEKNEVTIGRLSGNDIVLAKGNVSKYHSRIVLKDGKFIIVDMKSTNGTFVNGKKIAAPQVVRPSDKIYIGDYILNVEAKGASPTQTAQRAAASSDGEISSEGARSEDGQSGERYQEEYEDAGGEEEKENEEEPPERPARSETGALPTGTKSRMPASMAAALARKQRKIDPRVERYSRLQKDIHDRLIEYLDLRRLDMDRLGDEELWRRTEKAIKDILDQMETDQELPDDVDREELLTDVLNEALGLGPLEAFIANEEITEIMVNHANQIYIEKKGKLFLSEKIFSSNQAVLGVIERIVAPIGRRIDESSPLVDARLKDGSRVNAIIPPLALKGPCLTIRKFKRDALRIEDLIRYKTVAPQMAEFLEMCVKARKNIVISGGTGSGKTTTLNVISSFIPDDERIVTVEDAAELQLPQDHWVQLESRPPNLEGKGAITIRDLVKNCLRMRPDRIVVGECRSGEALDMLQAMNTGHDGSLTTLHANTPRDALSRLETMVLMAGMDLPVKAIREQIASAVNIIVQQTRFSDGTRKVCFITEISGMEVDVVTLQDIFYFKQEGFTEDGKVKGRFVASGFVPRFYDDLQRRGIPVNMSIFRED